MFALIDPITNDVQYISSWAESIVDGITKYAPIISTYPDSERICQISTQEFEVSPPLFWVFCDDDVVADQYYYDNQAQTINKIINAPFPGPEPK